LIDRVQSTCTAYIGKDILGFIETTPIREILA
jgi:hypothetical protein